MSAPVVARFRVKTTETTFVYPPWRYVEATDERAMRHFLNIWADDIELAARVETVPEGVEPVRWAAT